MHLVELPQRVSRDRRANAARRAEARIVMPPPVAGSGVTDPAVAPRVEAVGYVFDNRDARPSPLGQPCPRGVTVGAEPVLALSPIGTRLSLVKRPEPRRVSHLEDLLCEYYEWQGYIVRRNIKVGRLGHGGWEGELDIVAYHPKSNHLVHLEPSLDA